MKAKKIYTNRQDARDACDEIARETGREHVLMTFSPDGGNTWRDFIISRMSFFAAPLDVQVETPLGTFKANFGGYTAGPDGKL